ncbi:MAG: hypothetical protein LBG70_04385 [Bifidobacteriaceae bacterium]|jgi:hypothetical protein|nr:hypothetical protein [Bifidobacteriaceae bacterium]
MDRRIVGSVLLTGLFAALSLGLVACATTASSSGPLDAASPAASVVESLLADPATPSQAAALVQPSLQVTDAESARERALRNIMLEREEVHFADLSISPVEPSDIMQRQEELDSIIQAIQTADVQFALASISLVHEARAIETWWKGQPPAFMADLRTLLPNWVTLVEHSGARFTLLELRQAQACFVDAGYMKKLQVNMLLVRPDGAGIDAQIDEDAPAANLAAVHQVIDECLNWAIGGTGALADPSASQVTRGSGPVPAIYPPPTKS